MGAEVVDSIIADLSARNAGMISQLNHLSAILQRAQAGDAEAGKLFSALGINIAVISSAVELFAVLIDRLSSISDTALRASVEIRLFGERGWKLDPILSGSERAAFPIHCEMQDASALDLDAVAACEAASLEIARLLSRFELHINDEDRHRLIMLGAALIKAGDLLTPKGS